MQPGVAPPLSFPAILLSSDYVRLIADYLQIDDLMTLSTLSRSLHTVFDGEAVWQGRLRLAKCIQRVDDDAPVPASAVLSAAQLAALPPLPSLSEAASLCLLSFTVAADSQPPAGLTAWCCPTVPSLQPPPAARVSAIVHLPSTLCYHARIVQHDATFPLDHKALYIEFALTYCRRQQKWIVARTGRLHSGWRAINIDDNIGLNGKRSGFQAVRLLAACPVVSSKQRYIDLLKCSEHQRNQCYRLLPASPPLPVHDYARERLYGAAPIAALPLCASCRTLLTRCIHRSCFSPRTARFLVDARTTYTVLGVTRINSTTYETSVMRFSYLICLLTHYRVSIAHRQRTVGERIQQWVRRRREGTREGWNEQGEGYEAVAQYSYGSAVYKAERNVCQGCQCGISKSGMGHSVDCGADTRD